MNKVMIIDFSDSMHTQIYHWLANDKFRTYEFKSCEYTKYSSALIYSIDRYKPDYIILMPGSREHIPENFYLKLKLIAPIPRIIFMEEEHNLLLMGESISHTHLSQAEGRELSSNDKVNPSDSENKDSAADITNGPAKAKDMNEFFAKLYQEKKSRKKDIRKGRTQEDKAPINNQLYDLLKRNFVDFIIIKYPDCFLESFSRYTNCFSKRTAFERYAVALDFFLHLQLISPFCSQLNKKYTLKHIMWYVFYRYTEEINLKKMSKILDFQDSYISGKFSTAMGIGLLQYVNRLKISKSIELLLSSNNLIGDIATQVGYDSTAYFSNVFTTLTGMSPKIYREKKHYTLSELRAKRSLGTILQIMMRMSPKESRSRLNNLMVYKLSLTKQNVFDFSDIHWSKIVSKSLSDFDLNEHSKFLDSIGEILKNRQSKKVNLNQTIGKTLNDSDIHLPHASSAKQINDKVRAVNEVNLNSIDNSLDRNIERNSDLYLFSLLVSFMRWSIPCELASEILHCLYIFLYKATMFSEIQDFNTNNDFLLDPDVLCRLQIVICGLISRFDGQIEREEWKLEDLNLAGIDIGVLHDAKLVKEDNKISHFKFEKRENSTIRQGVFYSSTARKREPSDTASVIDKEIYCGAEVEIDNRETRQNEIVQDVATSDFEIIEDENKYQHATEFGSDTYKLNVSYESVAHYLYDYFQDMPITQSIEPFEYIQLFKQLFYEAKLKKKEQRSPKSVFSLPKKNFRKESTVDDEIMEIIYREAFDLPHLRRKFSFGIDGAIKKRVKLNMQVILSMIGIELDFSGDTIDKIFFSI